MNDNVVSSLTFELHVQYHNMVRNDKLCMYYSHYLNYRVVFTTGKEGNASKHNKKGNAGNAYRAYWHYPPFVT